MGSFQSGVSKKTEAPLENMWSLLGLYGSEEYLQENATFTKRPENKDALIKYTAVRMRQSGELRLATRRATLLTAPLTLYYSILNLTRASMAVRDEIFSSGHGLKFDGDASLLRCRAKIINGTFSEYLKLTGVRVRPGTKISLDECLSRIIEMYGDYFTVTRKPADACPIRVNAYHSGKMLLNFNADWVGEGHFRSHWQNEYPSLDPVCELEPEGCVLKVKKDNEPKTSEDVQNFCRDRLESSSVLADNPTWYIVRHTNPDLVWPRPAYYFAALFILGSIVRYQPELMYDATSNKL
jgi:hypothetical protein